MTAGRAMRANRIEDAGSLDYFPSAPWLGRALGEVLERLGLPLGEVVEEPAAGEGHLAHGLRDVWPRIRAFDVYPYPRRSGAVPLVLRDYLADFADDDTLPCWTVSNPPFGDRTGPFIRKAVARSRIGAAMLLQLRLVEGPGRHRLFRECGLYATAVIPRKRSGLRKGVWVPGQSTATAYAWFIFVRPGAVEGWGGFDGEARQIWIDPEAGQRLSRDSDLIYAGVA
ncbi:hypothetical protein [Brevundimonas sp. UBA5866]|uniref:hypothetical protein n=1 Tax=Brevundimonas sp. UBA5866 TaxID=1946132 RepID=UPI0025BE8416|nr:hypothetical protein [Brevundimonas sp. UBA5866]